GLPGPAHRGGRRGAHPDGDGDAGRPVRRRSGQVGGVRADHRGRAAGPACLVGRHPGRAFRCSLRGGCQVMTVLVTGAAGRVGSRLVPRLLRSVGDVRVLVRDAARASSLIDLGAEPVVGDLTEAGVIEQAVKGVAGVVHLATVFRPGPEIEAVNVTATARLAQAALAAGVERFVYLSSNQVYGPGRGRPAVET